MHNLLIENSASQRVTLSFTDNNGNPITPASTSVFVQPVPQTDGPDIHLATASISGTACTVIANPTYTGITTVGVSATDASGNDLQVCTFGIHVVQAGYANLGGFVNVDNVG